MRREVAPAPQVYAGSLNYVRRADRAGHRGRRRHAARRGRAAARQGGRDANRAIVRLADRAARLYAPVVHTTAALTAIGWLIAGASLHDAIVTAIAVLIITCPCALALAIPAVQVVASGALFRAGMILNAGDAIERLAEVDTVDLRQDRHADAAGAAGRQRRCESTPTCSSAPRGSRCRAAIRWRAAVAREARDATPYDGAVEEPGQGVRAIIDGIEARLGSPEFCGIVGVAAHGRSRRRR